MDYILDAIAVLISAFALWRTRPTKVVTPIAEPKRSNRLPRAERIAQIKERIRNARND